MTGQVDAGNRAEQLLAALQQEIQVLQHQANRPDLDLQALLRAMPAEELAETVFRSLDPRQLERFLRFLENFRRQDQDWTAIESDVEKLVPLPMAIVRHFVLGLAGDRYPELRTVEELSRKLQDEFFVRLEFRSKVDWFRAWALLRYGLKAAQVLHNPPHSVHQFVEEAMHYGAKRSSRAHSNDSATRTPPSPGMTSPPSAETGSRAAATQTHTSQRSGGTKPEPAQSERHWQPPQGGTRYASSHNSSTTGQTGPTPNSYPHNSANRPHNSGGDRRTPPTSSVKSPPGKPPAAADVLGLTWPATIEEIKAAYRRLAKQNHPDLGGDLLQFQQIQDAYQQLMAVVGR